MFDINTDPNALLMGGGLLLALFLLYIILTTDGLGVKFLIVIVAVGVGAAFVGMGFDGLIADLVAPITNKIENFDVLKAVKTGKF